MLEFRILGPLEVAGDTGLMELGPAKPRAVLGLLLVHANQPVPAAQLIDDLWEQRPPRSATTTLQTYISQLRKTLGPALQTLPTGYRLEIEPDGLDAARFEQQLAVVGQADDQGPGWVTAELREALGWWRGPALADFTGALWAEPERARLEGLRLLAVEDLNEARLALGEHARLVSELEMLVAAYPLRERLWAQLMLALYRSDRQADALRTYGRLRAHLGDELGIEPSSELTRLEQAILLHEPEIDWRPPHTRSAEPVEAVGLPTGVVSFLLTDIVDSTSLWDDRPIEMADALGTHTSIITDAVVRHGGLLIKQRGEGDSTFSVFTRATDAVSAAIETQRSLGLQAWPTGVELSVRIAIATGEALERDGDYYGTTVNRAARLRAVAHGGQILVSTATADLVDEHLPGGVQLIELGTYGLRGLRRTERVSEVRIGPGRPPDVAPSEPRADVSVSSMLAAPEGEPFVGRLEERAALDKAWRAVRGGERRIVLVAGEPGIGKTRIAAEGAQSVRAEGGVVLYGRCDDGLGVAFQPFAEALRHYVADCAPATLRALPAEPLAQLSRLLPELVQLIPGLPGPAQTDPETERYELFEAVVTVLGAIAARSPTMLILDDLHWAAKPSTLLLRHLARGSGSMPLLVLAAYRSTEAGPATTLGQILPDLRSSPGVEQIRLTGFRTGDIDDYLTATIGVADHSQRARELEEETRGNPLFIRELVRDGIEHRPEGEFIPQGIRDVIERRLGRLTAPTRRTLARAAVLGPRFSVGLLERTADDPEAGSVLDAIDEAIDAGVLAEAAEPADTLEFTHALMRDAIYTSLTTARRARLHRSTLMTLEALGDVEDDDPRLAALASHSAQAAPLGLQDKAAHYALLAGRQAHARLAFEEAIQHFERGLHMLEDGRGPAGSVRLELLLALAEARFRLLDRAGVKDAALRAAETARALESDDGLARAAVACTHIGRMGTLEPDVISLAREALAAMGPDDSVLRVRVLACLVTHLGFGGEGWDADPLAVEAVETARRIGEPETLALAIWSRWATLTGAGLVDVELPLAEELVELARQCGNQHQEFYARHWRVLCHLRLGDRSELTERVDELADIASTVRILDLDANLAVGRTALALLDGRFDDARAHATEILELAGEDPGFLMAYAVALLWLHFDEGRLEEIRGLLLFQVEQNPEMPAFRAALGLLHTEAREPADARAAFEPVIDDLESVPRDGIWPATLALLAECAARHHDRPRAAALSEHLGPQLGQLVMVGQGSCCIGAADRYLGMLDATSGDWDSAEAHFEAALTLEERVESPPLIARTKYWFGTMLLERARPGDREWAEVLLGDSLSSATELGMILLAGQAQVRLNG